MREQTLSNCINVNGLIILYWSREIFIKLWTSWKSLNPSIDWLIQCCDMKYRWGRVVGVMMRRSAVRSLVYILKCPSARNGTSDSPEGASLVCECAWSIISPDEQVSSCVALQSSVCKGNDVLMCRAHVHELKLQTSHTIGSWVMKLESIYPKESYSCHFSVRTVTCLLCTPLSHYSCRLRQRWLLSQKAQKSSNCRTIISNK